MAEEGWENVDRSFDRVDPNSIIIQLDLNRLGELVARVADQLCGYRGIDSFDVHSDEAKYLAIDAWRYVCHMTDRAEFTRSVQNDLAKLEEPSLNSSSPIKLKPPV